MPTYRSQIQRDIKQNGLYYGLWGEGNGGGYCLTRTEFLFGMMINSGNG